MMKTTAFKPLLVMLWLFMPLMALSQGPQYSEYVLKYNLSTLQVEDNKKIPFDHPFTLIVDSLSGKGIKAIYLFKSEMVNGVRKKIENDVLDTKTGKVTKKAIMDKVLSYKTGTDKLIIYFDALQPNTMFDVHVVYKKLFPKSRSILFEINSLLYQGNNSEAEDAFDRFEESTDLEMSNTTYTDIDFNGYTTFYQSKIQPLYAAINNSTDRFAPGLDVDDLIAIGIGATKELPSYKDTPLLMSIITDNRFNDVMDGRLDILQYSSKTKAVEKIDWQTRIANLKSNTVFIDKLLASLNNMLLAGKRKVKVQDIDCDLFRIREKIVRIQKNAIEVNLEFLKTKEKEINKAIDDDGQMTSAIFLSGSTLASDLKTAGGNLLFLDAGLTNIMARGIDNSIVNIPRLYWGVSIYFRPIDKNTRRSSFYSRCKLKDLNKQKGPDYDAISTWSIWQHLCLNIGFTIGSIPNAGFDNLYNNTSLLIGPAFRFKRAFKFSAGTAFTKRASFNPMISEKRVNLGGYASLSVDIDFIQGLKDVTSILFK